MMRKYAICLSFMYSLSGMASTSSSVNSVAALVFQLLASLASFLAAMGEGGAIMLVGMVCR